MNERSFQRLKNQIEAGDNKGLTYVFEQTSRYCVRTLIKKTNCDLQDAEDIFMDAIIIFRENILSGRVKQLSNIRTYLFGICWNLWRDLNRAKTKWQKEQSEVERQLSLLMVNEDRILEEEDLLSNRIKQVQEALQKLSTKCQELLTYVYIEKRPQKEIANIMGFASPGVVKVSRHRCYQQWIKRIENAEFRLNGR